MNVKNRTIFEGDNLYILRGLDSETIDLIYLDPPFNSNRTYEVPIGSEAVGAAFRDAWTLSDLNDAWHGELAEREPALYSAISAAEFSHSKGMKAYLIMMSIRILEMYRILKPMGSIYLHCDPTASHYLKTMMDAVFGRDNFQNEVVWSYRTSGASRRKFSEKHDVILFYSKSKNFKFNTQKEKSYTKSKSRKPGIVNYGAANAEFFEDEHGVFNYVNARDVWDISYIGSTSPERTGYPTQKPLALLERIIKASSNPNDIVLDPFCGCATTCIAAEKLQRQWIGIDLSPKAVELVQIRIERDLGLLATGEFKPIHRTDIPQRLVQDEPRQIHVETLFGIESEIERVLSQIELRQYRSYKHTLFGLQEGKCNGCEVLFPFRNMTIDHIIPRSRGGTDDPDNLQLLCGACNSTKGNRTQEELIQSLRDQNILR